MAKVYLDDITLTAIANQTRRLAKTQGAYTPSEMAIALSDVPVGIDLDEYFNSTLSDNSGNVSVTLKSIMLIKKIKSPITVSNNNANYLFQNYQGLEEAPTFSGTKITSMEGAFYYCRNLKTVPKIDTSNVTSMANCFYYCDNLETIAQIDTKNVANFSNCFSRCNKLKNFPILDMSSATNLESMFNGCSSFTDESLDNMLQSLISATSYTGTKTLYYLALRNSNYSSAKVQSMPHYQDFVNAGWSIGY